MNNLKTIAHSNSSTFEEVKVKQIFSGPAIAATLSPLLGFYMLMISHHVSRLSKAWDQLVHAYGYWGSGSKL